MRFLGILAKALLCSALLTAALWVACLFFLFSDVGGWVLTYQGVGRIDLALWYVFFASTLLFVIHFSLKRPPTQDRAAAETERYRARAIADGKRIARAKQQP